MDKINFNKGSLSFWILEGSIDYEDNKFAILVNYTLKEGALKIVKNKNNGLQVYYDYKNNGKCSLTTEASDLDNNKKHMVAVTWSMENLEVILYIDGKKRARCDIDVSP